MRTRECPLFRLLGYIIASAELELELTHHSGGGRSGGATLDQDTITWDETPRIHAGYESAHIPKKQRKPLIFIALRTRL